MYFSWDCVLVSYQIREFLQTILWREKLALESCSLHREIGAVTFRQRLPILKYKRTAVIGCFFFFFFCTLALHWTTFIGDITIPIFESWISSVNSDHSQKVINASNTHNNYNRTACLSAMVTALNWCTYNNAGIWRWNAGSRPIN